MHNEMVSVVVPIYNMEKYLERCVHSIESQSYNNIEVILVDDGSKDNSANICKELCKKYKNIKTIFKENGGVSTARNEGMKMASGEWIMFVDPDDYLKENIVEVLISVCDVNVDVAMCSCIAVDNERENICHFFDKDKEFNTFEEKKELYKQLMKMDYGQVGNKIYTAIGVPWAKLYRLDMIKSFNISFDINLRRVQDNIFNMEVFSVSNSIYYIDKPLYVYNYEHMSSFFNDFKSNHTNIYTAVMETRYSCMNKYGLLNDEELYKFYVNEAIIVEANIMKYGIFHRKNPEDMNQKIKNAKNLSKRECFVFFMNKDGLAKIDGFKYKVFWWLIKLKLYMVVCFLSQLK